MKLHQHVCTTTKKRWDAQVEFLKLYGKYAVRTNALLNGKWKKLMDSIPRKKAGGLDFKKMTKEQSAGVEKFRKECRDIAKKLGLDVGKNGAEPVFDDKRHGLGAKTDPEVELFRWTNNRKLHSYLTENVKCAKKRMAGGEWRLAAKDLKKMVDDGICPETFEPILKMLDKDHVVLYWFWTEND